MLFSLPNGKVARCHRWLTAGHERISFDHLSLNGIMYTRGAFCMNSKPAAAAVLPPFAPDSDGLPPDGLPPPDSDLPPESATAELSVGWPQLTLAAAGLSVASAQSRRSTSGGARKLQSGWPSQCATEFHVSALEVLRKSCR